MTIQNHVRTLASASLLALAIASVAVGGADAKYASDASSCRGSGHVWSDQFGCLDATCQHNGKTYQHGEGYRVTVFAGQHRLYVCNGFTGEFDIYRTADPQGPQAPANTTTGTNAPPEQAPANPLTAPTTGTYSQPTQPTPVPVVPLTTGTSSQR